MSISQDITEDEVQYIKNMYELRDYIMFHINQNETKKLYILLEDKTISYGSDINNPMKSFAGEETSLDTLINLLISEYEDYSLINISHIGIDLSHTQTSVLKIKKVNIAMTKRAKFLDSTKFLDADKIKKVFKEGFKI